MEKDRTVEAITKIVVELLKDKIIDGITYLSYIIGKDDDKIKFMEDVISVIKEEKGSVSKYIKKIKVSNGVVYEINPNTVILCNRMISNNLLKAKAVDPKEEAKRCEAIEKNPERRAKEDIEALAKYLLKKADEGVNVVEFAIYSANQEKRIEFMRDNVKHKYRAYALRYEDIAKVNTVLNKSGYKIDGVKVKEILPTNTGISTYVKLDKI